VPVCDFLCFIVFFCAKFVQMDIFAQKFKGVKKQVLISIYLDTRRAKSNGLFPVKLKVYCPLTVTRKYYPTSYEFSEIDFKSIWETTKKRKEHKDLNLELKAIEAKAYEAAKKLPVFNFEDFERLFIGASSTGNNDVIFYYQKAIQAYFKNNQIKTAQSYELSLKSIQSFDKKQPLNFFRITPQWLKDYENFMIEKQKRSQTTVGIYLRPLRAIFNKAISDKVISFDIYPFGKRKYTIPAPKGVKKALNNEQLGKLFKTKPATADQQKAKDFWFFSYACNGMNFKDVLELKYKNLNNETIIFRRSKTLNTHKTQMPVTIFLNDFTKSVIEKYGNPDKNPDTLIFPILNHQVSPEQKYKLLNNFIRYVNQHMVNFAKTLGINEKISTYWARHSFATNAIRNGASMEFISEALSHSNLNTTKNYFAGFDNEKKREFSENLMNF
jgi:integrase/recombinase XerD